MAGTQSSENEIKEVAKATPESASAGETQRLSEQYMEELFSAKSTSDAKAAEANSTVLEKHSPFSEILKSLTIDINKDQAKSNSPQAERTAAITISPGAVPDSLYPGSSLKLPELHVDSRSPGNFEKHAVGNNEYQIQFGEAGRTDSIKNTSTDGLSSIELMRDADGSLRVSKASGEYQPANGIIKFEGLPITVGADGKVQGEISFRSNGEIRYCANADAADRTELIRKSDGSLVSVDLKNWKRTTLTPTGEVKEHYWDGYEWRMGEAQADGKIKFVPPDASKPDYMKRTFDGSQNSAEISWADGGKYQCDFARQMQVKKAADGTETRLYYNGASYMEASSITNDQPQPGDVTVQFKEPHPGDPASAILHKDGKVSTLRADNTIVVKDQKGYVNSVSGPKGNWEFQRDVNGDIIRTSHTYPGKDGNQVTEVMTRQGKELYPGMEYWRSRAGHNYPRAPFDLPPRPLDQPIGYNSFMDGSGNLVSMNINVCADGTVRIEQAGADNSTLVSYESPGQDMYKDLGSMLVSEHAGGVTETFDKQSKVSIFKFNRAGKEYTLSSNDGKVEILTDGTVIQDKAASQSRDYYMPNGVVANIGSDGANPPKPVCKMVQIPQKDGQLKVLKNGEGGVSNLQVLDDMSVQATITGESGPVQTVFSARDNSVSTKTANENFWRVSDASGNFVGTALAPGQLVWNKGENEILGPGGLNFERSQWDYANPAYGAAGELLLLGKGAKAGTSARLELTGIAVESSNGADLYSYPDKVTRARFENGKLASVSVNGKLYKPLARTDGSLEAVVDESGSRLDLPEGTAFQFEKNLGRFVGGVENKDGMQSGLIWDPASNTTTFDRLWQTSQGQQVRLSVKMNRENQVLQFALPGVDKTIDVPGNESIKSADFANGGLVVLMADGRKGTFNADGSYQWEIPGSIPPLVKFSKDGVQLA